MMELQVTLALLLAVSAVAAVPEILNYTPKIANIAGNVTDQGFVLVQPDCTFQKYTTAKVWLVVALNTSYLNLNDTELGTPATYSSFMNGSNSSSYYHTLMVSAVQYPCLHNSSSNFMYLLQIGSELNDTQHLYSNGPLNSTHTYRTTFILLQGNELRAKTKWSPEIRLKTAKNFTYDGTVGPSNRSAGMIVLTVLLSILLAILLICLIVALVNGSQDICWRGIMDNRDDWPDTISYMSAGTYNPQYKKMNNSSFRA